MPEHDEVVADGGRPPVPPLWALLPVLAVVAGLLWWLGRQAEPGEWTWALWGAPEPSRLATYQEWHLLVDVALVAAYGVLAVLLLYRSCRRAQRLAALDPSTFRNVAARHARTALKGATWVLVGALADLVEDAASWWVLAHDTATGRMVVLAQAAAWVKWMGLVPGFAVLVLTDVLTWLRRRDLDPGAREVAAADPEAAWAEAAEEQGQVAICLSGGGIRSASFSLGALQAARMSQLDHVDHVTSVSGGGYMAAAWASMTGDGSGPPPFEPRSDEERWVRHHTNYLVSSAGVVLGALGALLSGVVVNLLLVLLLVSAFARPTGWLLGAVHPELRANEPILEVREQPALAICDTHQTTAEAAEGGTAVAYVVTLGSAGCAAVARRGADGAALPSEACASPGRRGAATVGCATFALASARTVREEPERTPVDPLVVLTPALVVDGPEGLVVSRQPTAVVRALTLLDRGVVRPGDLEISRQPRLEVDGEAEGSLARSTASALSASEVRRLLEVDQQPRVRQRTGTVGRPDLAWPAWMQVALGLLAAALVLGWLVLPSLVRRRWPHRPAGVHRHEPTRALGLLLAGAVAVLYLLPLAVDRLPALVSGLPGVDPSSVGWESLGAVLLAIGSLLVRLRSSLAPRLAGLGAFRGRGYLVDGAVGLVSVLGLLAAFVALADLSAANGPGGRLSGVVEDWVPSLPDALRWAAVAGVLLVALALPFAAHAWSLHGFYRGRVGEAYVIRPASGAAGGVAPRRAPSTGRGRGDDWGWGDTCGIRVVPRGDAAEWTVCTTANVRGSGEAAPGRSASSFTFSGRWVGGPHVGWMATEEYLARIGPARARDVAVRSAVAISGAAFSPAMGKDSKPWSGRVFALANLRLGVWVPNPMLLARRDPEQRFGQVLRPPGVAWYLRELVGWYDRTAPYVYLSDGGHWDNLGLVEALRRRCSDVWLISAAGDGADSFETFAQAQALAREELGVDIGVELEPLRAPAEPAPGTRRLLRDGEEVAVSPASWVPGTIRYPDGSTGRLTVVEATVGDDLPWDVHAYAEANADFPNISTGYQLMQHRDFEAYRMLGYVQMAQALHGRQLWPGPPPPLPAPTPAGT